MTVTGDGRGQGGKSKGEPEDPKLYFLFCDTLNFLHKERHDETSMHFSVNGSKGKCFFKKSAFWSLLKIMVIFTSLGFIHNSRFSLV